MAERDNKKNGEDKTKSWKALADAKAKANEDDKSPASKDAVESEGREVEAAASPSALMIDEADDCFIDDTQSGEASGGKLDKVKVTLVAAPTEMPGLTDTQKENLQR